MSNGNGETPTPVTPFPPHQVAVRTPGPWHPVEPPVVIDSDDPGIIPLTIETPATQAVPALSIRRDGVEHFAYNVHGGGEAYGLLRLLRGIILIQLTDSTNGTIAFSSDWTKTGAWHQQLAVVNRYGHWFKMNANGAVTCGTGQYLSNMAISLNGVLTAATAGVNVTVPLTINNRLRLQDEQQSTAYGQVFVEGGSLMYTNPDGQKQQLVSVTVSDQEPATPRPGDVWVDVS